MQKVQELPFSELHGALMSMASLFYPTENFKYTAPLGYYRQREWRIISGLFFKGQLTTTVATGSQAAELMQFDREFFSRELDFADGRFTLAAKSHYFLTMNGQHILTKASRLFAPATACEEAAKILHRYSLNLALQAT